jgi:hypothetical protein
MQQYLIIIFLVISIFLNLFLLIKIRGLIIKNLYYKNVPKEIRDLQLPHPGNQQLIKDKSNYRYATMKKELNKEKRILPFLPFEKKSSGYNALSFFRLSKNDNYDIDVIDVFLKYDSSLFDNLRKGDKIISIQFKIPTGYYFLLGEPSGKRDSTIPYDIDLDTFDIYLANMDEKDNLSDDFSTNYKKLDNLTLVKEGIKWNAIDWPFGKEDYNDFGPHIEFDTNFVYTGGNLVVYIKLPKSNKTFYFCLETFKYEKNKRIIYKNKERFNEKKYENYNLSIRLGIKKKN